MDRPSQIQRQGSTNFQIVHYEHCSLLNSQSETKFVYPWSPFHFKSHPKLKTLNPRKSQKLKKILEMMKNEMKWDFTQGQLF